MMSGLSDIGLMSVVSLRSLLLTAYRGGDGGILCDFYNTVTDKAVLVNWCRHRTTLALGRPGRA